MSMSKTKAIKELDKLGVAYDSKATAYELKALYDEEIAKRDATDDAPLDTPEADVLDTIAEGVGDNYEETPIETVEAFVTCAPQLALRSKPCKPGEDEEDNLLAILGNNSRIFIVVGGDEEWAYVPGLNGYVMRKFLAVS